MSARRSKAQVDRLDDYAAFVDRLLADGRLDAASAELQHMGGALKAMPSGRGLRNACEAWLGLVVRLAEARIAQRAAEARRVKTSARMEYIAWVLTHSSLCRSR